MAGRHLTPMFMDDFDFSSNHYSDVRPIHDRTQRTLIGRAMWNAEQNVYDVDLRYDLRDPQNHFVDESNPKLTKRGYLDKAFEGGDLSYFPLTRFSPGQISRLEDAGVRVAEQKCRFGKAFEFSVVADLVKDSKHDIMTPDYTIDFNKPLRQSPYRCLTGVFDDQEKKAFEIKEKGQDMAMDNTDRYRKERDESRPKKPVSKDKAEEQVESTEPTQRLTIEEMREQADANTVKLSELFDRAEELGKKAGVPFPESTEESIARRSNANLARMRNLNRQARRLAGDIGMTNDGQDGPSFEG